MTNRIRGVATCVVFVMVSLGARVQDKPDFSGTWILESGPSGPDIPQTLLVRQSLVRTNVRGEPMEPFFKEIAITRALPSGTRSDTYPIGVDGGTVRGSIGDPRSARAGASPDRTHYRVAWEEQRLVIIESGSYTGSTPQTGNWAEREEVWSLDSGVRLRVAITTSSSVGTSTTVTLVYRRQ
jgi:hypothetical protein